MTAIKIAVIAVAGVILVLLLRRNSSVYGAVTECALVVLVVSAVIPEIKTMLDALNGFNEISAVSDTAIKTMFKAFAFLTVGSIAADICLDNSEGAVAGAVELAVKVLAVSSALPLFSAVIEVAVAFFNR